MKKYVIGLDLGGTKLASAIFRVNSEANTLDFCYALEPIKYGEILGNAAKAKSLPADKRAEKVEDAMVNMVEKLKQGLDGELESVGVCSAGFIEKGGIKDASNIGIKNYSLQPRLEQRLKVKTFLYKDSWAPVFAIQPSEPGIIFSIGTGFGGVSCEANMEIKLLSYTASNLIWIPYLYANDDPGFAVSFSPVAVREAIRAGVERFNRSVHGKERIDISDKKLSFIAEEVFSEGRRKGKGTPPRIQLLIMNVIAPKAVGRFRSGEIFADFFGSAPFSSLLYRLLTGEEITPPELDVKAYNRNPAAVASFYIQAEFIGFILFKMQKERMQCGLPPALLLYGTGSGYNEKTRRFLSNAIIEAMMEHGNKHSLNLPQPNDVDMVHYTGGNTTLAAYGAAMGAFKKIQF